MRSISRVGTKHDPGDDAKRSRKLFNLISYNLEEIRGIPTHGIESKHVEVSVHPPDYQRIQVVSIPARTFCVQMILGEGPKYACGSGASG